MSRFRSYSIGDLYEPSKPGAPLLDVSQWTSEVLDEHPFYERDELTGAWMLRDHRLVYDSPVSDMRFVWRGDFDVRGDKLRGGTVTDFDVRSRSNDSEPLSRMPSIWIPVRGPQWEDLMIKTDQRWLSSPTSTIPEEVYERNPAFESATSFFRLAPLRSPTDAVRFLHTVLL